MNKLSQQREELQTELARALQLNKLEIAPNAQQKLIHFLELMQKWNRVFNLSAIMDHKQSIYLHIIDSLIIQPAIIKALPDKHEKARCLDVGSGAGLPGIPLAIVNPEQKWVLIDKNSKKTRFLTQAVAELGLTNVSIVHERVDAYQPEKNFDLIVSRAFSSLSLFVQLTLHALKPEGRWLAMKGLYPQRELADIEQNMCDLITTSVLPLKLEGIQVIRHAVVLKFK